MRALTAQTCKNSVARVLVVDELVIVLGIVILVEPAVSLRSCKTGPVVQIV